MATTKSSTRPAAARSVVAHPGNSSHESFVETSLSDGSSVLITTTSYLSLLALGFVQAVHWNSNDKDSSYARMNSWLPDGRKTKHTVSRLIVAMLAVAHEMTGGQTATAKGFVVSLANGDPRDLRNENLIVVAKKGANQSYNAVWDVRARWRCVADGVNPDKIFLAKRKAKCSAAKVHPWNNDMAAGDLSPVPGRATPAASSHGVAHAS